MFEYTAIVVRIVDGDTVDLDVDLGFKTRRKDRFRLEGIDTPEVRTKDKIEKAAGLAASARLAELIPVGSEVTVRTNKPGKYGRWIATILKDGVDINQQLVKEGHAVPYE